ncbi:hypothetical protein C8F01DRAFT_1253038 [Mycena amicta]|nr:hypothetical protein C8F01DRAFT_1253038 [Mycena amicta]
MAPQNCAADDSLEIYLQSEYVHFDHEKDCKDTGRLRISGANSFLNISMLAPRSTADFPPNAKATDKEKVEAVAEDPRRNPSVDDCLIPFSDFSRFLLLLAMELKRRNLGLPSTFPPVALHAMLALKFFSPRRPFITHSSMYNMTDTPFLLRLFDAGCPSNRLWLACEASILV